EALVAILPAGLFADMLVNGVLAGVGAVIVFLPNILILFFCIAIFEDTGYMARAAFLMDKVMHLMGLHGKSFIPLLMGFGCNVPAIMATRTLENERDRILTILINPLMSCSARLPVYILLAGTFFAARAGTVIFGIYILGIVLAVLLGRLFRSTILKGESAPFVMELPPYRLPMLKSLLLHMWDRAKMFLKKMGGIILVGSIVIWFLSSFPQTVTLPLDYEAAFADLSGQYESAIAATDDEEKAAALGREYELEMARLGYQQEAQIREQSYLGRMGKAIAPVFEPLGLDWRGAVAIISGFVAKEVVVSTLAVLHASDDDPDSANLSEALLRSGMTPLAGLAMMAFVLLYVPCFATVTMVLQETRSWQWTGFMVVYSTVLAWIVAFVIFQGGRAMGLG
ncbi:MAG: ferrous iron transport protein B, partial [Desulfatibacillaceae bacterium]|nr:ferrous iron transport protein B [Desulfatibacillaceae bacterium]